MKGKLPLFSEDMIFYIENPKESIKKFLKASKQVQQSYRMQNQHPQISLFLYTSNEQSVNEIKKITFCTTALIRIK